MELKLQIRKWGNSLAIRLPAGVARAIGAKVGGSVDVELSPQENIEITPTPGFDKAAFLKKINALRAGMPMTSSTVESMRKHGI